jgi:hypothetical protein
LPRARAGWWIFIIALVTPALLTMLAAGSDDLWPIFTFPASAVAGLHCGFWMASRLCRTVAAIVFAGLALAAMFSMVSFALCCVGCALGGAQLNFH